MRSLVAFPQTWLFKPELRVSASLLFAFCLFAAWLGLGAAAEGQSAPSGWEEGYSISVGGTASGYYLGYGARKIAGPAAFFDIDTRHRLGIEGEARWLLAPQTADVHNTTWLIGGRYTPFRFEGRFSPYVKGLVGFTQFNFPYNYAKGDYFVVAPGAGLDYRLSRRVRLRVVDFEYQFWPQFTFNSVPSYGISTGIRVRVF